MFIAHRPTSPSPQRRYLTLFLVAAGLEALLCLVWLFSLPSDTKNALVGRFSVARLAMGGLLLAAAVISGAAAWLSRSRRHWEEGLAKRLASPRVVRIALAGFMLAGVGGSGLLLLPPAFFADFQYAFARLRPLIAWPVLVCLQSALALALVLINHSQVDLAAIRADFQESLAGLGKTRSILPALLIGGATGAAAALILRPIGAQVLAQLPWMAAPGLAFGGVLLGVGLLYNQRLVRWIPKFALVILLIGLAANVLKIPAAVEQTWPPMQRTGDWTAVDLGQKFHYSLSIYHILSRLYPQSEMVLRDDLDEVWNVSESRLRAWVPVTRFLPSPAEAHLNDAQAAAVLEQDPLAVEINTLSGTRIYYFLRSSDPGPARLVLADHENQRFFLPVERYERLMKEYGDLP